MALFAQRLRDWSCLLALVPQTLNVHHVFLSLAFRSPAPKMQTSSGSSHPEGASLESCYSASSAHGTDRTEAHRLGLLACLATSNFKCSLWGLCQEPLAAVFRKSERLQIAGRQKGLAWKAVAQPHLPMALLAQRHREWGCLLSCHLKLQT